MLTYQNYHRHSHYTNVKISDSCATNEDYANRAVELGHGIISTGEHGYQGRYIEGYELAKEKDLVFVFGTEAYWVKDRFEKDRANCHIWLGARNENGRQAINDILAEANITGFYYQPRLDVGLILSLPREDVICTTSCIGGWKYEDADQIMLEFANHFGKNFFLEVQYHNTLPQKTLNRHILELAEKYEIEIIMGCDSHYILNDGSGEQLRVDFLYSKGLEYPDEEGWFLDYPNGDTAAQRFRDQGILSEEQILRAIDNTNVFLEVEPYDSPVFNKDIKMPSLYPFFSQEEKNQVYEDLIWEKWENEKPNIDPVLWDHYEDEIRAEVQVVKDTNHADYFLIDHEVVKLAKTMGGILTKTGRGSAVSFYTNKLLGLTDIDRIAAKVKMYPDRFMSTTRILETKSLADIDLNLANPEVFGEAQKKLLGGNSSYPMVAYGVMQPAAAWKLYAKSQGVDFDTANEVSNQIKKWQKAIAHAPEDERDSIIVENFIDPKFQEIYDQSKMYQGIISSWSPHPCSHLLYDGNIRKEVGLINLKGNLCTLMDGKWAEKYGFMKNDFLRVSVVDLIAKVYRRIGIKQHTVDELLELCDGNQKVWDIYAKGIVKGINQVEQNASRAKVVKYKPGNISELCAFVAAVRPGFKSMYDTFEKREKFSYDIPAFDNLITTPEIPDSFVLYQEQAMLTLNFAGIPMSECYGIIKSIAKKRAEEVYKHKERFIDGFTEKTRDIEAAEIVWQILEDSSGYSFNACLDESEVIWRDKSKAKFTPTIGEMYNIKNYSKYARETNHRSLHGKYQRAGYGKALSLYPEMRIKQNNILDIRDSGVQEVFLVTTETGEDIKCTLNHKFPTPFGELKLKDLQIGDELYIMGKYEKTKDKYRFTDGNFESNLPQKGQRGFQKKENSVVRNFNEFRKENLERKSVCEICGTNETNRWEIHHKDFNRTNGGKDNLMWLCVSCHKKEHFNNGRVSKWGKGRPVLTSKISSIKSIGKRQTYNIEMDDPAHNFVVKSGIVTSNSHAYSVAIDSLYGAYLKSHYPLQFYEVFLKMLEAEGAKDRFNATKEEAQEFFNIKFSSFKFRQDNREITADIERNSINNSLGSIKSFGKTQGKDLFLLAKKEYNHFTDLLIDVLNTRVNIGHLDKLIRIDYFSEFGTIPDLLRIVNMFEFLKRGEAKTLSKDKLNGLPEELVRARSKETPKKFTLDNAIELLYAWEEEVFANSQDYTLRQKAEQQLDILEYVDLKTGKEEDRLKLFVLEVRPIKTKDKKKIWAYKLKVHSLGNGIQKELTVRAKVFNKCKIQKYDVIQTENNYLKQEHWNGFSNWYVEKYWKGGE